LVVRAESRGNGSLGFDAHEAEDLRDVETRLLRDFGAAVGVDEVRRCVESAYAYYERIRVWTYVVLLTERRGARDLRAISQA
jgi:hypothetical protein